MKISRKLVSLLCGLMLVTSIIFSYPQSSIDVSAGVVSGQSIGTIDSNDSIYQIMVDRFYDGDLTNNGDAGTMRYLESSEDDFRYMHGGDWQGIIDKIDYIKDMGYTAIWISPVTEPQLWNIGGYPSAYHGYNMYDPNKANQYFGVKGDYQASLDKLKELVDTAHANGIKVIIDVVPNHVGDYMEGTKAYYDQGQEPAAPFNNPSWYHHNGDIDWSNEHPHTDANVQMLEDHDLGGLDDIDFHNSEAKQAVFDSIKGFFDYTGADGARVDAAKCMYPSDVGALEDYLGVNTYGECFDMDVDFVARWVGDNAEWGMLDFPLFQATLNGFAYGQSFDDTSSGALSLKNVFAQDYYYNGRENNMVVFVDNHDKNRFLTEAGGSVDKLQNAITFIYAARGVPVVFQGTEQNRGNINNTYISGIADTWNRWSMFTKDSNGNITGDYFNKNTDTYQLIANLNNARNQYEALRTGQQREMWASSNLYAFSRRVESGANEGQETFAVFSNATYTQTETIPLRVESTVAVGTQYVNALDSSDVITVTAGGVTGKQITVSVGANHSKIYVPVSVESDTEAPTVPTNVTSPSQTGTTINLTWTASTDNVGVVGYEIYRGGVKVGTSTTTSYTDTNLTPETTYEYTIKAYDAASNISAASVILAATTTADTSNIVTIYYKKGFDTPYIHYRQPDGTWTTVPGLAMPASEVAGYNKITIDIGSGTQLEACFNDGNGTWDNNSGSNYLFGVGTWTFNSGTITAGAPTETSLIPVTFTINNAYTNLGQNVYTVGNCDELGNWNTANAIGPATCPNYPTWTITIDLPAGQYIEFKAIKKDGSGSVEWQGGDNKTYTVPTSGSGSVTIDW